MMKKSSMNIGIAQRLSHRLLPLAVVIGLFLGFGAPLTYWALEHRNLQHITTLSAEELAAKFRTLALDSPELWKYQTHRFIAISEGFHLSLIHISEPTRRTPISYAVFCLKKKKKK